VEKAIQNAALKSLENDWYEMGRDSVHWDISVSLSSGDLKIMAKMPVVKEKKADNELPLETARKKYPAVKIGEVVEWDITSKISQRVVAQNARQGILQ